jgi:prepilin-type N-terminal cleavage/methylation domain-containing protein
MLRLKTRQLGFTIVELLIVIVVIGILASITIVSYNGIQARASDAKIRTAATQIEKALQLYVSYTAKLPVGGSGSTTVADSTGCTNGSSGWFAKGTWYVCAVEDDLLSQSLIPATLIPSLPKNKKVGATSGTQTFMGYDCGANGYTLLWYLDAPTAQDIASYDSVAATCGYGTSLRDSYGMQAGRIIRFS